MLILLRLELSTMSTLAEHDMGFLATASQSETPSNSIAINSPDTPPSSRTLSTNTPSYLQMEVRLKVFLFKLNINHYTYLQTFGDLFRLESGLTPSLMNEPAITPGSTIPPEPATLSDFSTLSRDDRNSLSTLKVRN